MSVALPAAVQGRRNCCVLTPRMEPPTSLEAERQTPAEEEAAEAAPARGCFTRRPPPPSRPIRPPASPHPPPPPSFRRLSQNSDPEGIRPTRKT